MLAGAGEMDALAYAGTALAAAGLAIEALADFQLAAFRSDPAHAGQVMDRGLWAWSRHPNYFGEAVMWAGFFTLGFSASHAWWLILSPVLVCFLLLQVSGIPVVEEGIGLRRPAYAIYRRKVSAFLPMVPRR
jgi:steroid 5-alpha reductase family enzyme